MGVVTMVRLVQERQRQEEEATERQVNLRGDKSEAVTTTEPQQEQAKHAVTTALEQLTGFIPAEVIVLWGAAVGFIAPEKAFASWMILAAALVFLVVLLFLEVALRDRKSTIKTDGRRRNLMIVLASVAFIVWAFATPGSPAAIQWGMRVTPYFGVIAIAVSGILPKISQLLDLVPVK
jgi:cation transport ATPase